MCDTEDEVETSHVGDVDTMNKTATVGSLSDIDSAVDVDGPTMVTLYQLKEMNAFLEKKIDSFNGAKVESWTKYVKIFETVCFNRGFDKYGHEILVELLSGLLVGKARDVWVEWSRDDPSLLFDYDRLKNGLMLRLGGDVDYWKSITEFHNMKMGVSDDINEYSDKYIRADNAISVDAYKAAKYFPAICCKLYVVCL